MKNFTMGVTAMIVAALALTPGCGDDDDDNDGGGATTSGGKGGSGGTTGKGGSTSKGGTSAGGDTGDAGAGNTSAGGTPGEGGDTSTAGAPGAGGAGGAAFMNPEGCPATAPATNDACSVDLAVGDSCQYPGSRCVCNGFVGGGGAGGAMAGNWICQGDGGDCPETAPATDDECADNGMLCPYPGDINCFCQAANWSCDDPMQGAGGVGNTPGSCPADEPADEDACNGGIYGCLYDAALCNCPGAGPNADEWACEGL